MPVQLSLVVFFDVDRLPEGERFDVAAREKLLADGIKEMRRRFPDLTLTSEFPAACAVSIQASEDELVALEQFLNETQLGSFEFDGEFLVSAAGPAKRKPSRPSNARVRGVVAKSWPMAHRFKRRSLK